MAFKPTVIPFQNLVIVLGAENVCTPSLLYCCTPSFMTAHKRPEAMGRQNKIIYIFFNT